MKRALCTVSVAAGLLIPATLSAQNYSIDWYTIGGGGGTSAGGPYSVTGTIGQADTGTMSGGPYSIVGGFWSLVAAIQQPSAPTLFLTQTANKAILSWTTNATGFLLESNVNLALPANWTTVLPSPTIVGNQNFVTNSISAGNRFYRLHHP